MGFASTLFSTNYSPQIIRLVIFNRINVGGSIKLEYDDQWGHHHTYEWFRQNLGSSEMVEVWNVLELCDYPFLHYREGEIWHVDYSAPGGNDTFDCTLYFPATNIQLTYGPGGNVQVSEIQAYQDGAAQCHVVISENADTEAYFSGGRLIYQEGSAAVISFKDFFKKLAGIFNLGMTIEPDGVGGFQVRVEYASYFYSAAPALTITNIKDVRKSLKEDQIAAGWWLGGVDDSSQDEVWDSGEYVFVPTVQGPTYTYKVNLPTVAYSACPGNYDLRMDSDMVPFVGYALAADLLIDPAVPIRDQEDTMYLCYTEIGSSTLYQFMSHVFVWLNPLVEDYYRCSYYDIPDKMGQIYFRHKFDLPAHTYRLLDVSHLFDLAGNYTYATIEGTQSVAAGLGFAPVIWEFTRFISFAEFSAIINSQQITLNQGSDPANDVNAFIEEVEFRIFDGETKFKMSAST